MCLCVFQRDGGSEREREREKERERERERKREREREREERIFADLMTSDRKLKASRKRST